VLLALGWADWFVQPPPVIVVWGLVSRARGLSDYTLSLGGGQPRKADWLG